MEGISSSSEQQTASMEEITDTANRLGTLAEGLRETLASISDGDVKKSKDGKVKGKQTEVEVIKKK